MAPIAFWVGARALRFDPSTVADGITSIRRGYTPGELRALLAEAGVRARVSRRPGYRLVATWRTGPGVRAARRGTSSTCVRDGATHEDRGPVPACGRRSPGCSRRRRTSSGGRSC